MEQLKLFVTEPTLGHRQTDFKPNAFSFAQHATTAKTGDNKPMSTTDKRLLIDGFATAKDLIDFYESKQLDRIDRFVAMLATVYTQRGLKYYLGLDGGSMFRDKAGRHATTEQYTRSLDNLLYG
jgi:hypothetical protein